MPSDRPADASPARLELDALGAMRPDPAPDPAEADTDLAPDSDDRPTDSPPTS